MMGVAHGSLLFPIRKSLETQTLSLEYFLYRLQCKTPVYFFIFNEY